MKLIETCEAYKYRGDYTLELKDGESVHITGNRELQIRPNATNTIRVRCKHWKEEREELGGE